MVLTEIYCAHFHPVYANYTHTRVRDHQVFNRQSYAVGPSLILHRHVATPGNYEHA